MNESTRDRYIAHYTKAVSAFISDVGELNAAGIPEVHLPLWGCEYGKSPRIAFVGRDTRNWGLMEHFVNCAKRDTTNVTPLQARVNEVFLSLPLGFKKWTNNSGTSFWDTVMRLVAGFHGIADWRQVKTTDQHDALLQSFVWANAHSVELWNPTGWREGQKADKGAWSQLKAASERHFDSFSVIQEIFRPEIAIVMTRNTPTHYWKGVPHGVPISKEVNYSFDPAHGTHVFHTAHPNYLGRRKGRIDEVVGAIASKWKAISKTS